MPKSTSSAGVFLRLSLFDFSFALCYTLKIAPWLDSQISRRPIWNILYIKIMSAILEPSQTFESFRTFELFHDSDDREQKGLTRRKIYRTVTPQVTENLNLHARATLGSGGHSTGN